MAADAEQTSNEPLVLRDDAGGVATLTLNRPQKRNALSAEMLAQLQSAFDAIAGDKSVKAVILAANGPVFCAGHDLKEMRADPSRAAISALFEACSRLMISITRLPQPVIARVHAMATAAGCQLVATCDLAIASAAAKFATPGVTNGLFCSTPAVAVSRKIGRKHAMEMLLTGEPVDAETAFRFGLVNKVVPAGELAPHVAALAASIAGRSSLTISVGKDAFYRQIDMNLEDAYAFANGVMVDNMQAHDAAEGIDAFLEKREPKWQNR